MSVRKFIFYRLNHVVSYVKHAMSRIGELCSLGNLGIKFGNSLHCFNASCVIWIVLQSLQLLHIRLQFKNRPSYYANFPQEFSL